MFLKSVIVGICAASIAAAASPEPLNLAKYKGKILLLDFWATTCGGCKTEIPWFIEFQKRYKGQGLAVLGVSLDEDGWKSVRPFVKANKVNYPIVIGNDDLAGRYKVDSMPTTLLIDRQGKIVSRHVGVVDKNSFERELRVLLK